ncbi:MAG TPA: tripartite tricarboxylate transporter substrate-binding protein [Pseudolabrys sp.]|nr:tripartite tricarboxylate transporter substrate-binding protein [Pseudolabrys sp.]
MPDIPTVAEYDKLNFNLIRDIAPVASIHREPFLVEVNPSVSVKTVPELIAYAKANPADINMASRVAACGTCAAGGDAGDRISRQRVS